MNVVETYLNGQIRIRLEDDERYAVWRARDGRWHELQARFRGLRGARNFVAEQLKDAVPQ